MINKFVLLHLRVLIGPHMFSSYATSQTWCSMPRNFMPVKAKQRQNVGGINWLINTLSNRTTIKIIIVTTTNHDNWNRPMKNIPCTILPWWIGLQNIIYSRVCITLFQIQIGDDKKVLRIKFCSISQIPIMVTHWCKIWNILMNY